MTQKLTKTFVENLPYADSGQVFYRDSELKGFAVRIGKTSKVYVAESKLAGKTVRVTIGKHGVFTCEEARSEARAILGQVARHINPNDELKAKRAKSVSCAQVQEDYLRARKNLKPTTVKDYRRIFNTYLGEWANKPLSEITKDMVERQHRKIGERRSCPSQSCTAVFPCFG